MKKGKDKSKQLNPEGKGHIVFMIMNILLGLLILYFGIYFLADKYYIEGALALLLGIFSFLPKRIIKISQGKKFLIVIILSIVLFVLSVLFSRPIPEEFINHNMQEEIILDMGMSNISLIVYNATESTSINGETTKGHFIFINCGLTNLENFSVMIKGMGYHLNDNQNETFEGKFNGIEVVLEPDIEKTCHFLFEVPKTAQELKLHIEDNSPRTQVIDLKM